MRAPQRFVLAAIVLAPATFAQTTWYVDDDGTGDGSGTIDDPYTSIQFAIDQPTTLPGDIVEVADGTYFEDIDLAGKLLLIRGDAGHPARVEGVGLAPATITAPAGQPLETELEHLVIAAATDGSQRCLELEPGANLDVGHVLFEGGKDAFLPDSDGGQVRVGAGASLVLDACVLHAVAETPRGGAIAVDGGHLSLLGCDLTGEAGFIQGRGGIVDVVGGVLVATGCIFRDGFVADEGDHGGALALLDSVASLDSCSFYDAHASQAAAGAVWASNSVLTIQRGIFDSCSSFQGAGGAMVVEGGLLEVKDTEFIACGAFDGDGGAVYLDPFVDAQFERCGFFENTTYGSGWGFGDGGAVFGNGMAKFRRCLFVGNVAEGFADIGEYGRGGAVTEALLVECCTFFANAAGTAATPGSGGALAAGVVSSSIVWGGHFPDAFAPGVVAAYCDVQGGWPGEGNLDADPKFCDLEGGDFGLCCGSPCVDAGDPGKPYDEDGTPADQGAVPFQWMPVGQGYCVANPNSSGASAVMTVLGCPTLDDDFIRLRATSLPPFQFGYFLAADTAGFVPHVGGGMGNLCLGMPFVRLNTAPWGEVLFSGLAGRFELRADLLALPADFRPAAGETWHFQAWFRDVVGSDFTSNTSDAVELTFE